MPYFAFFEDIFCGFLELFGNTYQLLFVVVTQCDKQRSEQQTKILFVAVTQCNKQYCKNYPISLLHITKKLERKKTKTKIHPYLNFTSAIKLLWGTFLVMNVITPHLVSTVSLGTLPENRRREGREEGKMGWCCRGEEGREWTNRSR